jgi:hypothetical protein
VACNVAELQSRVFDRGQIAQIMERGINNHSKGSEVNNSETVMQGLTVPFMLVVALGLIVALDLIVASGLSLPAPASEVSLHKHTARSQK